MFLTLTLENVSFVSSYYTTYTTLADGVGARRKGFLFPFLLPKTSKRQGQEFSTCIVLVRIECRAVPGWVSETQVRILLQVLFYSINGYSNTPDLWKVGRSGLCDPSHHNPTKASLNNFTMIGLFPGLVYLRDLIGSCGLIFEFQPMI